MYNVILHVDLTLIRLTGKFFKAWLQILLQLVLRKLANSID